jgi:hypothetical protein
MALLIYLPKRTLKYLRLFLNITESSTVRRVYTLSFLDHTYIYIPYLDLKRARTLFYKPFAELEGVVGTVTPPRLVITAEIEQSIRDKDWIAARKRSAEVIQSTLDGLRYLQT